MTVVVYKMVSGEEVIAKMVEFNGGVHIVDRARVLRMVPTNEGPRPALLPWVISLSEEEVSFKDEHVMVWKDAPKDVEMAYLEQTSGLQLAQTLMG